MIEKRNSRNKKESFKKIELLTIEVSDFIVVDLPEDVVAEFSAEGFEFIKRVVIE